MKLVSNPLDCRTGCCLWVCKYEKDYQSVLWESAGFMQVKVGA